MNEFYNWYDSLKHKTQLYIFDLYNNIYDINYKILDTTGIEEIFQMKDVNRIFFIQGDENAFF